MGKPTVADLAEQVAQLTQALASAQEAPASRKQETAAKAKAAEPKLDVSRNRVSEGGQTFALTMAKYPGSSKAKRRHRVSRSEFVALTNAVEKAGGPEAFFAPIDG